MRPPPPAKVNLPVHAISRAPGAQGEPLAWIKLVMGDVEVIMKTLSKIFRGAPTPSSDPRPLWELLRNFSSECKDVVRLYWTTEDDGRRGARAARADTPAAALTMDVFACSECRRKFAL